MPKSVPIRNRTAMECTGNSQRASWLIPTNNVVILGFMIGGFMSCGFMGCDRKPPSGELLAKPRLPALQALPPQTLQGLNIRLKPQPNASTEPPEWIALELIEPERIALTDSFTGMSGFKCLLINGEKYNEKHTSESRKLAIYSSSDAIGEYSVSMFEDTRSIGADGKPGVMAISWDVVPKKLGYCAFVYSGQGQGSGLDIAAITNAKTVDDLSGIQIRYRYKAVSDASLNEAAFAFDFRLGFEGEHDFENRLDLGRVIATHQWQSHVVEFEKASNVNQFLNSIAQFGHNPLSLNFSHVGSVSQFQSGDKLLLDDFDLILPKRLGKPVKSN